MADNWAVIPQGQSGWTRMYAITWLFHTRSVFRTASVHAWKHTRPNDPWMFVVGLNKLKTFHANIGWNCTCVIQWTELCLKGNWKVTEWHSNAIQSLYQTFQSTISWLNGRALSCETSLSFLVEVPPKSFPPQCIRMIGIRFRTYLYKGFKFLTYLRHFHVSVLLSPRKNI